MPKKCWIPLDCTPCLSVYMYVQCVWCTEVAISKLSSCLWLMHWIQNAGARQNKRGPSGHKFDGNKLWTLTRPPIFGRLTAGRTRGLRSVEFRFEITASSWKLRVRNISCKRKECGWYICRSTQRINRYCNHLTICIVGFIIRLMPHERNEILLCP